MCGISGILNFHNRPIDKSSILKLNGAISHRGLDNSEILIGYTNKNFSNYETNVIISDKLKIKPSSKIKIIIYEYLSIIYNFFKGKI